jgi:hypothetical protein
LILAIKPDENSVVQVFHAGNLFCKALINSASDSAAVEAFSAKYKGFRSFRLLKKPAQWLPERTLKPKSEHQSNLFEIGRIRGKTEHEVTRFHRLRRPKPVKSPPPLIRQSDLTTSGHGSPRLLCISGFVARNQGIA